MKKRFSFALVLMLSLLFVACEDKNAPGKTEDSSLPALARHITNDKFTNASSYLLGFGFASSEDSKSFYYPASLLSGDPKQQEKNQGKDNMIISVECDKNNVVTDIEGTHLLTSAEKALSTFKMWYNYLPTRIKTPALYQLYIMEGESVDDSEPFIYMAGAVYEEFKKFQLNQLDLALVYQIITQEEYDKEKARYSVTKQDAEKKIASLSTTKVFYIYEKYVELLDASSFNGITTVSSYENNPKEDMSSRVLLHTVTVGNCEDALGDYLIENN